MRTTFTLLLCLIYLSGYGQSNTPQGKYKSISSNDLAANLYNNQATLTGVIYEDTPFCFWGTISENDTAFVFTLDMEPAEYFAYYRNDETIDPAKRKITVKTHRRSYQTEFAIGKNLSMNDLIGLKGLDEDPSELENDTTVFVFYVDKHENDSAMISRMVYSSYVEFHYALPDNANDIVFVRNDNLYNPIPFIVFYHMDNALFGENKNPIDALYFERELNEEEIRQIQSAVPSLPDYNVLQKSRCFMPTHME